MPSQVGISSDQAASEVSHLRKSVEEFRYLGLTFAAEKPPPALVFEPVALMAAEESGEHE